MTNKELYFELRGVIADVEHGNGFDDVCLETIKRVADALAQREWQGLTKAEVKILRAATTNYGEFAQPEQTVSMDEYKRLQELVTSQGIRLMEYESKQEPEQEPVAWMVEGSLYASKVVAQKMGGNAFTLQPLYTTPPAAQRQWVGLTDDDYQELLGVREWGVYLIEAVEAKLKEKNA